MARYLQRYTGKFKLLAEYDRSTNDYPRIHGSSRDGLNEDEEEILISSLNKINIFFKEKYELK